ncbi:MAG TPA: hypothetical protein DEP84_17045, partial [Chloroflexi bacterium]|nr:hypothetical protein [Chloroflexota bacterium]
RQREGSSTTERRFTGQRVEGSSSLYDYQARYYAPALGLFVSPDPLVPEPGQPAALNRYSYALNNPLRYTDPTGHDPACGPFCNPIVIDKFWQVAQQLWVQAQALCVQHCPTLIQAGGVLTPGIWQSDMVDSSKEREDEHEEKPVFAGADYQDPATRRARGANHQLHLPRVRDQ